MIWLQGAADGNGEEEEGEMRCRERTQNGKNVKTAPHSSLPSSYLHCLLRSRQTRLLGRSGRHVSLEAHMPATDLRKAVTFTVFGRSKCIIKCIIGVHLAGMECDCLLREDT